MRTQILLYGSYGYTGQLIASECKAKNLSVILAGRNREALQKQSEVTGYQFEVVEIHETEKLKNLLGKVEVVIHCGGPFRHTAKAMAEACLETKTHYTDITGEYLVFEMLAGYDQQAKAAGVMLMPGTGFDVVPSDCLALHLKNKLPTATHLQLAFTMTGGGLSRGTKKSMIEGWPEGGCIRKEGVLTRIELGDKMMPVDFGLFKMMALCIPWGDVSTAWRSTGIPNIEVYSGAPPSQLKMAKSIRYFAWLMKVGWVKNFILSHIDKQAPGPSAEKREQGRSYLWGKAWDNNKSVEARLETLSGYALTAKTAVLIAEKILQGNFKNGYQTPAMAYGADLILEIATSKRSDIKI